MPISLKRLSQSALTGSVAELYIVPVGAVAFVKNITLANTTDAPVPVSVYIVPAGADAADGNILLANLSVPGHGLVDWQGLHVLAAGETLRAVGLGVTLTASGAEQ